MKIQDRLSEPIKKVRAMVCAHCWMNCFDTEGFERLGQRDVVEFQYIIVKEQFLALDQTKCPWCSFMSVRMRPAFISNAPDEIAVAKLVLINEGKSTPIGTNRLGLYHQSKSNGKWIGYFPVNFFTQDDDPAAQYVTARRIEPNVTPSNTCETISQWLHECAEHQHCPRPAISPLPTRVIEVTTPKIVHTNRDSGKFAALSYCWGSGGQILLVSSNLQNFTHQLNFDALPQTIKDAIQVTRSLSIPYLWVDALCIIQDEESDKAREIGSMAQIYGNAYLTIVASTAKAAVDGFLAPRASHDEGMTLPFRISLNKFGRIIAQASHIPETARETEPVDSRAWTLQESLMARRTLLYTSHTLQWRCATITLNLGRSLYSDPYYDYKAKLLSQPSGSVEDAFDAWLLIMEEYSSRAMSVQSIKLPAIAAFAEIPAKISSSFRASLLLGMLQYDSVTAVYLECKSTEGFVGQSEVTERAKHVERMSRESHWSGESQRKVQYLELELIWNLLPRVESGGSSDLIIHVCENDRGVVVRVCIPRFGDVVVDDGVVVDRGRELLYIVGRLHVAAGWCNLAQLYAAGKSGY